MKAKKKLKKIEKFLEDYSYDTISMHSAFHTIREIVDGTYQDEEHPEPEFKPGDQVEFHDAEDLFLNDFVWRVDATKKKDLGIATKISTWVGYPVCLKKVKE